MMQRAWRALTAATRDLLASRRDHKRRTGAVGRYGVAVASVLVAILIRFVLIYEPPNGIPVVTLFPAIILASVLGGVGPGVFSVVLGIVTAWVLFYATTGGWRLSHAQVWSLAVFAGSAAVVVGVGVLLRHTLDRLSRSEARLRAIVDTAVDAIITIDDQGRIEATNPAVTTIFGYTADELHCRNVKLLMPEPYRSEHDQYLANYLRTGERKIIGIGREVEGRRKNGEVFPLELAVAATPLNGDRLFTGILRDITERRETHRRLEASNALLTTIVEGMPDPVFAKDRDGRYLLANAGVCEVFNVTPQQILGAIDRDFYPLEVAVRLEDVDQRVMASGETIVLEEPVVDGHGHDRVYLSTKAPLRDAEGQITGMVGIAFDITERKRAEEDMRHAKAEAERANLAKSKFLAAASHDLRQPVQSLTLFLGLLKDRPETRVNAKLLGNMEKALEALSLLLNSLLDVSRLDAGLVVPELATVKLQPLLGRLVSEYRTRAEAQGLRLRTVDGHAVVRTDPVLLERILRNLLENSLKYTHKGGILLGGRHRGEHVLLEIHDTGIGIPAGKLAEIWEEFYQIDNPERDRAKGLGLGLAVVRRLAQLLDHPVTVRSLPGKGSSFQLRLPQIKQAEATAPPDEDELPNVGCGTVVVIEDDFLVRAGFEATLEEWGYTVRGAGSVEEASAVAGEVPTPDAILADYRLEAGTTGLQAIHAIHARLGRAIPAAIVTGDTAPERLTEARAGGFRLLHKPVNLSDLRKAVIAMLRERRRAG